MSIVLWALTALSNAQVTEAGEAVRDAMLNMSDDDVEWIWTSYNIFRNASRTIPVSWVTTDGVAYSGGIVLGGNNAEFDDLINVMLLQFYEVEERRTDTGLDAWYEWDIAERINTFQGLPVPDFEECGHEEDGAVSGWRIWEGEHMHRAYRIRMMRPSAGGNGLCTPSFRLFSSPDGLGNWTRTGSSGPSWWSAPSSADNAVRTQAAGLIAPPGRATGGQVAEHYSRPGLEHWNNGTYMDVGVTSPVVPHPDTRDGIRQLFAAYIVALDEEHGQLLLPPGLGWTVPPTPEQMPPYEGPPPGGEIDPGDCEEGWFLTRVVCEIRTGIGNIWSFISYDAWVPQTNWTTRWQGLQLAYQDRMYLFGGYSWDAFGVPSPDDIGSMNPEEHPWCNPEISVGGLIPFSDVETVEMTVDHWGNNWCQSGPAELMRTTGRQIITWVFAVGAIITIVRTATGRV